MKIKQLGWMALAMSAVAMPASAHTGAASAGLLSGLAHPLAGWDHLLAMVAVGLWGARQQGAARWALPLTFVGVMLLGAVLGLGRLALPGVETGIAVSVAVLGMVLLAGRQFKLPAAVALTALFAVFHGHAHGAELPAAAGIGGYLAGMALTTALLHLAGIVAGERLRDGLALRLFGSALTVTGLAMAL